MGTNSTHFLGFGSDILLRKRYRKNHHETLYSTSVWGFSLLLLTCLMEIFPSHWEEHAEISLCFSKRKRKKAKLRSFLSNLIKMLFSLAAPASKNCSKTEHVSVSLSRAYCWNWNKWDRKQRAECFPLYSKALISSGLCCTPWWF